MKRQTDKEKFELAKALFGKISDEHKSQVFDNLLYHAIMTDDVIIRDTEDIDELAEDTGEPRENF